MYEFVSFTSFQYAFVRTITLHVPCIEYIEHVFYKRFSHCGYCVIGVGLPVLFFMDRIKRRHGPLQSDLHCFLFSYFGECSEGEAI